MIDARDFCLAMGDADIRFITGVPDSLLKDVCAYISANFQPEQHIISANEGNAVGLAIGHYLATERPAVVYMQNSGLGNTINPLVSLADPAVYAIPMILMIGWRGEIQDDGSQLKDEPQHVKQGQITVSQLEVMDIPYQIINADSNIRNSVKELAALTVARQGPVALVVRKDAFKKYQFNDDRGDDSLLSREDAIACVLAQLPCDIPIVSTTGKTSRELFELRKMDSAGHHRDFLIVGGMGHASSIATGIANAKPDTKVVCLDGDGSMLMHAGALSNSSRYPNFMHIIINNGAHDSVGGQPTKALDLSLTDIATSFGYSLAIQAGEAEEIEKAIETMLVADESSFLEINCKRGARGELLRPDRTPVENKEDFIGFLKRL